jgi:hypothetical protein
MDVVAGVVVALASPREWWTRLVVRAGPDGEWSLGLYHGPDWGVCLLEVPIAAGFAAEVRKWADARLSGLRNSDMGVYFVPPRWSGADIRDSRPWTVLFIGAESGPGVPAGLLGDEMYRLWGRLEAGNVRCLAGASAHTIAQAG